MSTFSAFTSRVLFLVFSLLGASHALAKPEILYTPKPLEDKQFACFEPITKKLRHHGFLDMVVVMGYSDTIDDGYDIVTDGFTLNSVVYHITAPCQYLNQGFCEFEEMTSTQKDLRRFERDLRGPRGESLRVRMFVMNSSFDLSNEDNQTKFKDQQKEKSERVQKLFGAGIKEADVVFYEGHSRDGGGPDFSPPRAAANGKVNYPWYQAHQPGLRFLEKSLGEAKGHPQFLGLFSCASDLHFKRSLTEKAPRTTTILSRKVIATELTKEALLQSMESLLNFECQDTLKSRIAGSHFVVNAPRISNSRPLKP